MSSKLYIFNISSSFGKFEEESCSVDYTRSWLGLVIGVSLKKMFHKNYTCYYPILNTLKYWGNCKNIWDL